MKKAEYNIRVKSSSYTHPDYAEVIVDGYIFEKNGFMFGITRNGRQWTVTELFTGYKIYCGNVGETRAQVSAAAVELFFNKRMFAQAKDLIRSLKMDSANPAFVAVNPFM